jgi:hypothetical protein
MMRSAAKHLPGNSMRTKPSFKIKTILILRTSIDLTTTNLILISRFLLYFEEAS